MGFGSMENPIESLATGDSFDILAFGSRAEPGFDALTLDGAACSSKVVDVRTCGGGIPARAAATIEPRCRSSHARSIVSQWGEGANKDVVPGPFTKKTT
jgi:hypothetical protein